MAEKEATVFIIDVGRSMGRANHGRHVSDLDWSLQWFWDRITNIISLGRKTLFVSVMALGSNETNNTMADDDGYRHISILQSMQPMLMPELRSLAPKIKPSTTDDRDAISGIILAIDVIMRHCRSLQYKKKIYLLTNATGQMDPDDIESTAEQITQNNIELTVLGVDFNDEESKEEDKPYLKARNEMLLRQLVEKCGGVCGTMQEAIDSLDTPNIKPVRPTPTYKGQLRLSNPSMYDTAITIDIERYFKVASRRPPTASSFVFRTDPDQGNINLTPVQSGRVYVIHDETAPNNERAIDRDGLARGFQYGRTAVPISESDENITKLETEAGYEILGFIPRDHVERYTILDNSNMIIAQRGNDMAGLALSSLIHALFEIDSCAIGRFVKKDMTEPGLTLLSPYANFEVECLIENILPFAEDLRQYRFPPIDKVVTVAGKFLKNHRNLPSRDLLDAMDSFVDDMTIDKEDDMRIEDMFSPLLNSIEGAIKHRAVYPEADVRTISDTHLTISRQPVYLQDGGAGSLRDLIDRANVKKVPPKVKGRRKQREPEKPLSGLDVAALFRTTNRKISADNAIPEFKQIIEATESLETVHDAARQLMSIIQDRIRVSFGDSNYERAIEELRILRDELRELEEFDIWHDLIRQLKRTILSGDLGGNRKEMWWRIRNEKLGLIDETVEQNAALTKEEAEDFLSSR